MLVLGPGPIDHIAPTPHYIIEFIVSIIDPRASYTGSKHVAPQY